MSYNALFYLTRQTSTEQNAGALLPYLMNMVPVASLVDVGCGMGAWLQTARQLGVARIHGVEGPWIQDRNVPLDHHELTVADLSREIPAIGRFDAALCLEVGEHLPPARAESFVRDLCELAPVVIFSAAIPGQGGLHHVNEQWQSYWVRLFDAAGYEVFDVLRPRVWSDERISYWYRQNVMMFVDRTDSAAMERLATHRAGGDMAGADLVHPEHYTRAQQFPGVMALLRALPYAAARSFVSLPWPRLRRRPEPKPAATEAESTEAEPLA